MTADVIGVRPPRARRDATAVLGLVVALGSWAMMFGALFLSYAVLRAHAAEWPPEGSPRLPLLLPAINTAVIAASSASLQRALSKARAGLRDEVAGPVLTALALGGLFLALQFALWRQVFLSGLRPDSDLYGSIFWALTVVHALHVAGGLAGLCWVFVQARRLAFLPARHGGLRLWTAYWHFVGAVWLLLFGSVFVL